MTKRILIVEDTADNRQIMRDLLSSAGYELLEAHDGEQGVAMAKAHHPDLILMDIQLPVLDGYEATRRIRLAEAGRRHTPIIASTASAMSGDRERCLEAGMDDYLTKPAPPEILDAMLRRWMDASPPEPAPPAAPAPGAAPVSEQ